MNDPEGATVRQPPLKLPEDKAVGMIGKLKATNWALPNTKLPDKNPLKNLGPAKILG